MAQESIGRDRAGRIAGVTCFSLFLGGHLYSLFQAWVQLDLAARINGLLIAATAALFLAAYFLRTRALASARGWGETLFPLVCAGLPLAIYHGPRLPSLLACAPRCSELLNFWWGPCPHPWLGWNPLSMALVVAGNTLTLFGSLSLRRSFSIMVEAREPVYGGIYRWVRHPIYLGEILAMLGVLVFRCSRVNVALTLLFIVLQVIRSRKEERKLLAAHGGYATYRQQTGAFFPRWRR